MVRRAFVAWVLSMSLLHCGPGGMSNEDASTEGGVADVVMGDAASEGGTPMEAGVATMVLAAGACRLSQRRTVVFSRDGRRMAWSRCKDPTDLQVAVLDLTTGMQVNLRSSGDLPTFADNIEFSPDGRYLAWTGSGQLYVRAVDGSGMQVSLGLSNAGFVFTPDNRQIVLMNGTNRIPRILSMRNVDGSNERMIETSEAINFGLSSNSNVIDTNPESVVVGFTPDGTRMVYSARTGTTNTFVVLNLSSGMKTTIPDVLGPLLPTLTDTRVVASNAMGQTVRVELASGMVSVLSMRGPLAATRDVVFVGGMGVVARRAIDGNAPEQMLTMNSMGDILLTSDGAMIDTAGTQVRVFPAMGTTSTMLFDNPANGLLNAVAVAPMGGAVFGVTQSEALVRTTLMGGMPTMLESTSARIPVFTGMGRDAVYTLGTATSTRPVPVRSVRVAGGMPTDLGMLRGGRVIPIPNSNDVVLTNQEPGGGAQISYEVLRVMVP